MTKSQFWLWGILTIVIGTILQWYFCCSPVTIVEEEREVPIVEIAPPPPAEPTYTSYPFAFDGENAGLDFTTKNNIDFGTSSFKIVRPVDSEVEQGIVQLNNFLKANPDDAVDITGYYTDQESYTGSFPNLGLARANAVKNYFVDKEILSKQINTFGELKNEMIPDDTIYRGPLRYEISITDTNKEADELKMLRDRIVANPLVLYFETGEASINLTTEERQKIADISRYLDKVEGAKAVVTGHTDSVGRRKGNIKLGQERADFAKEYLVQNGISTDKIDSDSKGPDKPVASNKTKAGRAKNRRTVISIK